MQKQNVLANRREVTGVPQWDIEEDRIIANRQLHCEMPIGQSASEHFNEWAKALNNSMFNCCLKFYFFS